MCNRTIRGAALRALCLAFVVSGCSSTPVDVTRQLDAEASAAASVVVTPAPVITFEADLIGQPGYECGPSIDAVPAFELLPPKQDVAPRRSINWQLEYEAWRGGQGKRWLLVHIAGPNCGGCEVEAHQFEDLAVIAAAEELDCTVLDTQDPRTAAYKIAGIPADVFVDPTRTFMHVCQGAPANAAALAERITTRGALER